MYKFMLGALLGPMIAHAQPVTVEKPVICDTPKVVIETLTGKDYQEQPFWVGANQSSKFIMLVNEKTKTWSIIQWNNNIACVLGTGENSQQIFLKSAV